MPDGELRRPPQLWEQRLSRVTSILGVGLGSGQGSDGATSIVEPTPPPGSGGGFDTFPTFPAPGEFKKPSTPTVFGSVQGINVIWDGLNSDGDLYPYDNAHVELHMATSSTAFVPDGTATYQGYFTRPGLLYVGGLSAGVPYYFRLVGGNRTNGSTEPSDAATGYTGLTTSSDYGVATIGTGAVSFDARSIGGVTNTVGTATPSDPQTNDVWIDTSGGAAIHKIYNGSTWVTNAWGSASIAAGQITAVQLAAGAVTAGAIAADAITGKTITGGTIVGSYIAGGTMASGYLSSGTVNGGYVTGGTVNGSFVTGGTIQSALIQSASSGRRLVLGAVGETYAAKFTNTSSNSIDLAIGADETNLYLTSTISGGKFICVPNAEFQNDLDAADNVYLGTSGANRALRVDLSGNVYSYGVDGATTANAANVRVGASAQLLKSTSTQRVKTDIKSLGGELVGVDEDKISDEPASVNASDVLNVVAAEFQSLTAADADQRILGFIAENVAEAFPWAAEWDDEGLPSSVADRPILAALLQVVKEQQDTITALTARIEALEA